MMHRSRERCNLYTRVYLNAAHRRRGMHTVSYISLSTRKRSTWAQRIIGSHSAAGVTNGICPSVHRPPLPSTQVCVLPRPSPRPYINSAQFETYRRCLLLCVFADSSRVKPVFIASEPPLPGDSPVRRGTAGRGIRAVDEKSPGSGFQRAQERRNPARRAGDTIHLPGTPDARHDLYRVARIVVGNEFAIWGSAPRVSTVLITFFHRRCRALLNADRRRLSIVVRLFNYRGHRNCNIAIDLNYTYKTTRNVTI